MGLFVSGAAFGCKGKYELSYYRHSRLPDKLTVILDKKKTIAEGIVPIDDFAKFMLNNFLKYEYLNFGEIALINFKQKDFKNNIEKFINKNKVKPKKRRCKIL